MHASMIKSFIIGLAAAGQLAQAVNTLPPKGYNAIEKRDFRLDCVNADWERRICEHLCTCNHPKEEGSVNCRNADRPGANPSLAYECVTLAKCQCVTQN